MNASLRALNRFGLGARHNEAARISDPRAWLHGQVDAGPSAPITYVASNRERTDAFAELRTAQTTFMVDNEPAALREAARAIRRIAIADQTHTLARRVHTDAPFTERLVAFWSNHLCVSTSKRIVALLAGPYENEVARAYVFGRFEDLVLASARHPAMLLYLDNAQSVSPDSRAGRRPARDGSDRGLNENYARELLELHTVGVDGGYSQADVRALAHVLTGWTVTGVGPRANGEDIAFAFRPELHGTGARGLLGVSFKSEGEDQGQDAIRALCRHPKTARFVSTKLVRHFVRDEPPPDAVSRIEEVFLETQGDLAQVSHALVDLDDAWAPENVKYRTPQDWLVASLRALNSNVDGPQAALVLTQLRQPLWGPASPKGYSDLLRDWADPDGLMNRAELARTLGDRAASNTTNPSGLRDVAEQGRSETLAQMLGDPSISEHERIALALAAPAFQWR